LSQI